MLRSELMQLSSTLLSLNLYGNNFSEALFPESNFPNSDSTPDASDNTEPQSEQPKSTDMAGDNQNRPVEWNLDTTWPRLEILEVHYPSCSIPPAKRRYWVHIHTIPPTFGLLPRSLTRYVWAADDKVTTRFADVRNLNMLPPGLLTLLLPTRTVTLEGMMTLPKSITNVGYILNNDAQSAHKRSSLQLLETHSFEGFTPFPDIDPNIEHEIQFSSILTTIRLGATVLKLPAISDLPVGLTSLTILNDGFILDHQAISTLPRALKYLSVNAIDWADLKMDNWPAPLHTIQVTQMLGFGYYYFSMLPRTLTSLLCQPPRTGAQVATLSTFGDPTLLQSIGLQYLALEQEQWLAQKAQLLCIEGGEAYIKRVEAGDLYGLPLGLTELSIASKSFEHVQYLFPPLIRRQIVRFADISEDEDFERFPPNDALEVYFDELSVMSDASTGDSTDFALYRSKLKSIAIEKVYSPISRNPDMGLLVQCLPRSLTRLALYSNPISTSELEFFPNTLTDLLLRKCSFVEDDWVEMLPRSLVKLDLPHNATISGDCIHQLPPKLASLKASFNTVSITQARDFPPQLESLFEEGRSSILYVLRNICRPFWRIREYSDDYLTREIEKSLLLEATTTQAIDDIDSRVIARYDIVK